MTRKKARIYLGKGVFRSPQGRKTYAIKVFALLDTDDSRECSGRRMQKGYRSEVYMDVGAGEGLVSARLTYQFANL
jgi:hypothetical protein